MTPRGCIMFGLTEEKTLQQSERVPAWLGDVPRVLAKLNTMEG